MPGKHRSDALAAIHETAADLHRVGGMDQKTMRSANPREGQPDRLCRLPERHPRPGQQVGARRKTPARSVPQATLPRSQKGTGSRRLTPSTTLERFSEYNTCGTLLRGQITPAGASISRTENPRQSHPARIDEGDPNGVPVERSARRLAQMARYLCGDAAPFWS
jgi:hypothetical protein